MRLGTERPRTTGPWPLHNQETLASLLMLRLHGNSAVPLALALVLASGSAAAALALASVLALAVVLRCRGGAVALALALVLACSASARRGLAATLALTIVVALTDVGVGLRRGVRLLLVRGQLGAGDHAGHDRTHDLAELSTVHAIVSLT